MNFVASNLTASRWPLLAAIASALILGGAYFFEYVMGLPPCPLCYDQRHIHMAAILFGLLGGMLFLPKSVRIWGLFTLIGLTVAYVFHAGFEFWNIVTAIAIGIVAGASATIPKYRWLSTVVCLALGAVFLYSAGFAGWHAGIEYDWWDGPATCSSTGAIDVSTDDLLAIMDGTATNVVMCDEAAWTLFGISMAGYNALMSFGLAIASIWIGVFRK